MNIETSQATVVSWIYVLIAVGVALTANAISAKWAGQSNWVNPWLWPMLMISPIVFVTFGITAARIGLTLGSANIDSLLTIATIMFGLIAFREWKMLSAHQYAGVVFIIVGIVLTQFARVTPGST